MTLDTEYWRLVCEVSFRKTRDPLYKIEACSCKSSFAQIEDDRCRECDGTGWRRVDLPYPERPRIPPELLDHLSKAYHEWLSMQSVEDQYK